jgi:hypothetical protein
VPPFCLISDDDEKKLEKFEEAVTDASSRSTGKRRGREDAKHSQRTAGARRATVQRVAWEGRHVHAPETFRLALFG